MWFSCWGFSGDGAPDNKGVEALTEIEPGRLLAVTEGLFSGVERLRGWPSSTGQTPAAEPVSLSDTPLGEMRPTALAKNPGGDVLALERAVSVIGGIRVRLVRLARDTIAPGATLEGVELARFGGSLTVDNYEGLAVRGDDLDRLLVYMISDNNFSGFQRTLLIQFLLVY